MKTQDLIIWLLGIVVGLFISLIVCIVIYNTTPKVDLPEEYVLINPQDTLQGYYNPSEDKVYIWFNNKRNQSK